MRDANLQTNWKVESKLKKVKKVIRFIEQVENAMHARRPFTKRDARAAPTYKHSEKLRTP